MVKLSCWQQNGNCSPAELTINSEYTQGTLQQMHPHKQQQQQQHHFKTGVRSHQLSTEREMIIIELSYSEQI
jgi:hypothetical protein